MRQLFLCLLCIHCWIPSASCQSFAERIQLVERNLEQLDSSRRLLLQDLEGLKLGQLREDLQQWGLPQVTEGEEVILHAAMALVYDEKHEQAKWVAHVIRPEIIGASLPRTNQFRPDPKVETGSAVEADYFLKTQKADGSFAYDGFGYDRGHLAPSADFKWSKEAMMDSDYYSNMSPQLAVFNREKWAELEGLLRGYVYRHPEGQLYLCTGGLLEDDLPKVERGVNGVSVPRYFWKVALDWERKQAIGFLLPHRKLEYPIEQYAVTIDSLESLTGIDFFPALEDQWEDRLEAMKEVAVWVPEVAAGDVEPVPFEQLGRKMYNTVMVKRLIGVQERVKVIGTVVSGRKTRKGNCILNLDKQHPKVICNVFISKENLINFSYDPLLDLKGKQIVVSGEVKALGKTPTFYIEREESIEIR